MVKRKDLLDRADGQARAEARRRRLDEYDTADLIAEAKAVVDDFFDSITLEKVEKNVIKSRDPVDFWRHRAASDEEDDWRHMAFARADLQDAAQRYLDRPWLYSREMDWLIVDVLVYAEYQATLDFLRIRMMPFSRYIASQLGTTPVVAWSFVWRGLVTALKWAIWGGVMFLAAVFAAPVGPVILIAITAAWFFWKWKTKARLAGLLATMFRTYAHLNTVSHSWQVFWLELDRSRKEGAVWDGIVYRLVEDRMRTISTHA